MDALSESLLFLGVRMRRSSFALAGALLFGAILVLTPKSAAAQDSDSSVDQASLTTPPTSEPGSVLEFPAPPVTVEGDLIEPEPTMEERMQRFRESLAEPPSFIFSEQRLADGSFEATTRFGRFCANPVPAYSPSNLGGDVRLLARCAPF
jgi:hypothetical protein